MSMTTNGNGGSNGGGRVKFRVSQKVYKAWLAACHAEGIDADETLEKLISWAIRREKGILPLPSEGNDE